MRGLNLSTAHAHKRSNANLCRVLKFLGFIAEDLTYLDRVIMCDETWVHHYDPLTKWESEHWKKKIEPLQKKVWQRKSASKVMIIVFFDQWGPLSVLCSTKDDRQRGILSRSLEDPPAAC